MGKGAGFGKTIFIGDQFVMHGVPAIVAGLSFRTEATVERIDSVGWVLEDNRIEVPGYKEKKKEQQVDSINRILDVMKIDVSKTPIKITYAGDLLAGSGVGASAASSVSLARALNEEFKLGYTIEQINHVGWEGEFAYHGTPSGVDNTASTYGGVLFYQLKNEKKSFEKIEIKNPLEIVLANSGVTADTSKLGGYVAQLRENDPGLFDTRLKIIADQAYNMRKAIEKNDLSAVGAIMSENHTILIEMGLSHDILVHLCNLCLEKGAFGAKVTGGGRGGYMVALTPGKDLQEFVAAAMEKEGYKVIRAKIGGN